jgi:hypothetical protein
MEPRYGSFSSSVNPQELALSVEAFLKAVSFLGVYFFTSNGFQIDAAQAMYQQLTNLIVQLIPQAGAAWYTGQMIFGLLRKLLVKTVGVQ